MALRTRGVMWLSTGRIYGLGRAFMHEVSGLPCGCEALIANFGARNHDDWRIRRIKNGVGGHWEGSYCSVAEALTVIESSEVWT